MNKVTFFLLFLFQISFCQTSTPHDTLFVRLKDYSNQFEYDLRYATENNFLNAKVYDCAECYLRYKTVKKLIEANEKFLKLGYRIKLFDCYRPLDVQKKMWKIVPNPIYVADPSKGSIHNRGCAVDLTLVDLNGNELDMGTPFDHFGKEAAHSYENNSDVVKNNRKLLRETMESCLFKVFQSEWWHYNIATEPSDKISNFIWKCD
ncbi:MAG: M15 family metallopeptidase [Flavobacterium sp.]|jgi:D-alanyl-D-alanine dipeptidase|uniref:M15 family metallopeptidase n=1 Tax=Flavobacterium sp. TaxID=239 RepID=UPI003BA77F79